MSDVSNPYKTPASPLEDQADDVVQLMPARRWLRFANFIIDYVAFMVLSLVYAAIIGMIFGNEAIEAINKVPDIVYGMAVMLLYYVPTELLTGRTLGKLITGTKVVDEHGGMPTAGQILGRSFCRFIPFESFSFLGEDGRGWHDSIPKTYVIKSR